MTLCSVTSSIISTVVLGMWFKFLMNCKGNQQGILGIHSKQTDKPVVSSSDVDSNWDLLCERETA